MRLFFSLKLTLLTCCSPLAPSFARMSACSLPNIPQCAGIHCRTALLVVATCCRALVRFGSLWLVSPFRSRCFSGGVAFSFPCWFQGRACLAAHVPGFRRTCLIHLQRLRRSLSSADCCLVRFLLLKTLASRFLGFL